MWGDQHEERPGLSSQSVVAAAFFIAEFVGDGRAFGRFWSVCCPYRQWQGSQVQAIVAQDDSHTRHRSRPRNLAVAKHPGQRRQRIAAEAGTCEAVAQQMELVTRTAVTQNASQARCMVDMPSRGLCAPNRFVNGVDKGAAQRVGPAQMTVSMDMRMSDDTRAVRRFASDVNGEDSVRWDDGRPGGTRGRMVQARCLELDRSTQLRSHLMKRRDQELEHRVLQLIKATGARLGDLRVGLRFRIRHTGLVQFCRAWGGCRYIPCPPGLALQPYLMTRT